MLKISWRWLYRIISLSLFLAGLVFAATVLALRYWILPDIGRYREDIAASISRAAGQRVTIDSIAAEWDRLRPRLTMGGVQVYDQQGRPALFLGHVESTLSWRSLAVGELRLHSLELLRPALHVRRDAQDRLFVAGIQVNRPDSRADFADWVLRQPNILIRDAEVYWQDDKRQAPPLTLKNLNLRLDNRGRRHRFGLKAVPPEALAGPVDLRADLRGADLGNFAAWKGTVYARLDRADLGAWRPWIPFPFELARGAGGARFWLSFEAGKIAELTADLGLNGVRARLRAELPELELRSLSGRLEWRRLPDGHEFRAQRLRFSANHDIALPSTDFFLRYRGGEGGKPAQGEIRADGLAIDPLVRLADYLPLEPGQRTKLAELGPQGSFRDFTLKWTGEPKRPRHYSVKGQFVGLGMRPSGKLPGFRGVSGHVDATEKGGVLALNSRKVAAEFPGIFSDPLTLDALTARVDWKVREGGLDLNLASASFANADLAGEVYGGYHTVAGTPGAVDVTGRLTRADARRVSRYLPLVVDRSTREWLAGAILGGRSEDVRLRLKGNLADFPYPDGKKGIFEVTARVEGGTLAYAPEWPRIQNVGGDLLFSGARMEILARQGNTYGMNIGRVRAVIPDLRSHDEMLSLEGEASGPTNDMLRFIEQSPVRGMIDGFTEGMQAAGNGRLALKLDLPLRRVKNTRVSGSYQFLNNRIILSPDWPALEQVNGRLEFTEASVTVPRITAQALGGAVNLAGGTQKEGAVRIGVQGRATAAGLRSLFDHPLMAQLSGAADWHGALVIRSRMADVSVDSSLVGLASNLPAPFSKRAGEPVALHFERKVADGRQDTLLFSYGRVVSGQLLRRREEGRTAVERGAISFGGTPVLPSQSGIWVSGELRYLDLDHWRSIWGPFRPGAEPPEVTGLNMKFGVLDMVGKRLNDVRLNAWRQRDGWQAVVQGRELAGTVNWKPEGRGALVARLKHFIIPEAAPTKLAAPIDVPEERELPALDIVADDFQARQRKLGKLELVAVQEDADWRINKLKISNPDSVLQMDGLWQGWRLRPVTRANLRLEVSDLGRFFARFGYPNTVRHGTAKVEGQLSWAGGPQDIDNYPSLGGNLKLEARNGQFLKVEPGIGKLLGILSLQALPRRITLDFRDVFSEGFAFDVISGTMQIRRGVISSQDFRMDGPAAKVQMSGETDLVRETQNLRVRVTPVLGESVSVAGALLGGPVVGLTSLIVQKVLKDPLAQIVSYEYSIGGTWDNPEVRKLGVQPGARPETE
jgi:uncharacterized protein (TIGR02099 family)